MKWLSSVNTIHNGLGWEWTTTSSCLINNKYASGVGHVLLFSRPDERLRISLMTLSLQEILELQRLEDSLRSIRRIYAKNVVVVAINKKTLWGISKFSAQGMLFLIFPSIPGHVSVGGKV